MGGVRGQWQGDGGGGGGSKDKGEAWSFGLALSRVGDLDGYIMVPVALGTGLGGWQGVGEPPTSLIIPVNVTQLPPSIKT